MDILDAQPSGINKLVGVIYAYLNKNLATEEKSAAKKYADALGRETNQKWVWCESRAFEPTNVCRFSTHDLSPYFGTIPVDYLGFKELWSGIKLVLDPQTILARLNSLVGIQLDGQGISFAINAAEFLLQKHVPAHEILVSSHSGYLIPSNDAIIEDAGMNADSDESCTLSTNYPDTLAKWLGIPRRSELDCMLLYELEDWSQTQSLQSAIDRILDEYSDDIGIFKEFVQNAEDAGASRVRFVLDHNSYASNKLLIPSLGAYQGPALLIYNDAVFTEDDFRSLCSLNTSSKLNDPNKLGRYGAGFCSAYHITDLPSLVSASSFVVFDPSAKHLPKNKNRTCSGVRTTFVGRDFSQNQIAPFHDVDTKAEFKGTVFRLPLRTSAHAETSALKNGRVVEPEEVSKLLQLFAESVKDVLLFLTSVSHIDICEYSNGSKTPSTIFQISASRSTIKNVATINFEGSGSVDPSTVTLLSDPCILGRLLDRFPEQKTRRRILSVATSAVGSGKLFSGLPLPIDSGCPFHINADFALSSNRRSLIWGKQEGGVNTSRNIKWNVQLLKAAGSMIADLLNDTSGEVTYRFPTEVSEVSIAFHLTSGFYARAMEQDMAIFWYKKKKYSPSKIVFAKNTIPEAVKIARICGNIVIESLPSAVWNSLDMFCASSMRLLTPEFLRACLLKSPTVLHNHDVSFIESVSHFLKDARLCHGLQIVPLEDGSFGIFGGDYIHVSDIHDFMAKFKPLAKLVLRRGAHPSVFGMPVSKSLSNSLLHHVDLLFEGVVSGDGVRFSGNDWLSVDALNNLWAYISSDNIDTLSRWPILPLSDGSFKRCSRHELEVFDTNAAEEPLRAYVERHYIHRGFRYRPRYMKFKSFEEFARSTKIELLDRVNFAVKSGQVTSLDARPCYDRLLRFVLEERFEDAPMHTPLVPVHYLKRVDNIGQAFKEYAFSPSGSSCLTLAQIHSPDNAYLFWTAAPVFDDRALKIPLAFSTALANQAVPSIVVFRHIENLVEIQNREGPWNSQQLCEITDPVYEFMSRSLNNLNFESVKNSPIFWNGTTFCAANALHFGLSKTIDENWQAVAPNLMPYKKLVLHLGGSDINEHIGQIHVPDVNHATLQWDLLLDWFRNETNCDVTFQIGTQFIKAHRLVLALGCDYLNNWLLGPFKESTEKVIIVEDTSFTSFRAAIEFMYTGRLVQELSVEESFEALRLANFWGHDRLLVHASQAVSRFVNVDHDVRDIQQLAEECREPQLIAMCQRFLADNALFFPDDPSPEK